MPLYATAVFLGSFLLFLIQPLYGKALLPLFGGTPGVWSTCIFFFQTALLAGYVYAHILTRLGRRWQLTIHIPLLVVAYVSLTKLPATPAASATAENPIAGILLLLATEIGLPYLMLAASAPLLQYWFVGASPGRSPWRLYALSNAGSLLALFSYPFLVEPQLGLVYQWSLWGWGFVLYILVCGCSGLAPYLTKKEPHTAQPPSAEPAHDNPAKTRLSPGSTFFWLACSACGSATLLAVTNQICQEVAVVPLLWVLPLALYLATFIACFSGRNVYHRNAWGWLLFAGVVAGDLALGVGSVLSLPLQLLLYLVLLVACCMVSHGELYRLRPAVSDLTGYYLCIAAGGALGSAFVTLVAPLVFTSLFEFPLVVLANIFLLLLLCFRDRQQERFPRWLVWSGGLVFAAQLIFTVRYETSQTEEVLVSRRNFYGTLRVEKGADSLGHLLVLKHGFTKHGTQYLDANLRRYATAYYGPFTGAGLALRLHPNRFSQETDKRRLKVGLVGLGAGTLAIYGESGDTFRFYEINPDVVALARSHFSYLNDAVARIEVVPGDARLVLQDEARRGESQQFDVMLIDAFSSDAIPVHLATRQAVALYLQHLKPDGILLFHVSNRYLDLKPVITGHGMATGLSVLNFVTAEEPRIGRNTAVWVALTRNRAFMGNGQVMARQTPLSRRIVDWTDDYSSIWDVIGRVTK